MELRDAGRVVGRAACRVGLRLCVLGALTCAPVTAQAQSDAGARLTQLRIDQGLDYSDNPDFVVNGDAAVRARTTFNLLHERRTGIDSLSFNFGGVLEVDDDGLVQDGPQDPFAVVRFERDVRHSRLGVFFSHRESEVENTEFDPETELVVFGTGTRRATRLSVDGAIGVEAPLGATFRISRDDIEFSDDAVVDQPGQRVDSVAGNLIFRLSPTAELRAFTTLRETDIDDAGSVDRRTVSIGSAVDVAISQNLTGSLSLSYDRVKLSGGQDRTEEGFGIAGSLALERPTGSIGLSLSSRVEENGRRSQLNLSRGLDYKRGRLGFSLGATTTDTGGINPLYGLDWSHELPRATLSASFSQRYTTGANAADQIDTTLRSSYTQEINALSAITFQANLNAREQFGTAGSTAERVNLSLSYRRQLGRDLFLRGGVSHRRTSEGATSDRRANTIFLRLEKTFDWRR